MKRISRSAAAMMLVLAAVACGSSTDDSDTAGADPPAAEPGVEPSSDSASGKSGGATGQGTGDSASGSRDPSPSQKPTAPDDAGTNDDGAADEPGSERRDHNVAPEYDNVLPDTGSGQSPVLNQLSGSENGKCVDTSGMRNARSGGIAAGPFDEVDEGYGHKAPGKPARSIRVYWIPQHANMSGLTVRVTKASGGQASTITEKSVADAGQWKFYDTYVPIKSPGTWRLEARSGQDQGCFLVTVG